MEIPPPNKCSVTGQVDRRLPVILAKFSNGRLKQSSKIQLKFTSFESSKNKSSLISERILVANTNRLCYSGLNFESDTTNMSSILKVCIFNKKNSSIELYDASLFYLKPVIKCEEFIHSKDTRSFVEKNRDLALEFGSKSRKRSINSNLKHYSSVNPATYSTEGVTTIIGSEESVIQSKEICVPTENTTSVIPPQNKGATNPDEVYNIWDIISKVEYDTLESKAQIFLTPKNEDIQLWMKENGYSPFVIQYVVNNRTSINLHKAKLLVYLHYMLCFLVTTYADWRRKDPVPGVPEPFKQRLMDLFTIKRSMSQRMKDKLFSYAMVIGLMLHNYVFDGSSLAFSAKIPNKRLVSIAYALGCHVSEDKGKKIIQLKLPLYKFKAVYGSKQRKK